MTGRSRGHHILPTPLAERARRFAQGGIAEVAPRMAATVVLLRDGPTGLEVYVLERARSMAFAGGMYAFPGGAIDPADGDMADTALRELYEEAGVLLAGISYDSIIDDVSGWEADRQALVARVTTFDAMLKRRGLVPRRDLLAPWAHWITPVFEERRYDTRFFLALLPPGQHARDVSGEASSVAWLRPADGLDRLGRGEITMLPPTAATLGELAEYATAHAAFAAARLRTIAPITPQAVIDGEVVRLALPGDPEWVA